MAASISSFKTMDEYIASFPSHIQDILEELRRAIREAAPQAEEKISWQMPTFKLKKNLVFFAAHKHHVGFYPGPSAIIAFKKDLTHFQTSKGAVQFTFDKPIPLDLVKKMVTYRVKEQL